MEVRFRHGKPAFLEQVWDTWPSGLTGPGKNPATYKRIITLVHDHVLFVPLEMLKYLPPQSQPAFSRSEAAAEAQQAKRFFKKTTAKRMRLHEKRRKIALLLSMHKFTPRSVERTMQTSRSNIDYVRKLMRSDKGREYLMSEEPTFKRASITEGHVRAIREVMRQASFLFDAAWKLGEILAVKYPELPPLKLPALRRAMKVFVRAKWRKGNVRPAKSQLPVAKEERCKFSKVLLALTLAGADFVFADEYSTSETCGKSYGWKILTENKYIENPSKTRAVSSIVAISNRGVVHHSCFYGWTDSIVFKGFITEL